MTRSVYRPNESGEYEWFKVERSSGSESVSAFVHQDSFKTPLKHPVTGEKVESLTRWNQINKERGLRVVGNDCFSKGPRRVPADRITEEKVIDKIRKAEAICSDPARLREYRNRNEQLLERNEKLLRRE